MSELAAIVLAAGKSTRMKSELPKVLHEVCGQPMLAYVLSACRLAAVDRVIVVIGYGKDEVMRRFAAETDLIWMDQTEQKGTGHAVLCCREAIEGCEDEANILVIAGDMPLIHRETLANLVGSRTRSGHAVTLATTLLDEPTGYGRIVRDAQGGLEAIVEEADCTPEQRQICEVNPSYYCFDPKRLLEALHEMKPTGAKGEYYVTDVVRILRAKGHTVSAEVTVPGEDAMGINSRLDLAVVNRVMQDRIQLALMNEGVTIVDPDNTWIEAEVSIGRESVIYPFTVIGAGATIGEGCRIGPFARVGVGEMIEDGVVLGPTAFDGVAAS